MNIEQWTIELFKAIEEAAEKGENFDLHLESEAVQELAFESRSLQWIEMY